MEIKPVYLKVNLRRAMASEKLERFEDALEGGSSYAVFLCRLLDPERS